ncbi:MAG TPA: tautomerase family protein [Crenalkalicoccus sp.]|nr:tautomerase family protein [Crenalkalicoccus sp.]
MPAHRFVHAPSFLGLTYSEDFILLELTFVVGQPKETRFALLKELTDRVVAATGISPDDLFVLLYELPGENISLGRGLAQTAASPLSQA